MNYTVHRGISLIVRVMTQAITYHWNAPYHQKHTDMYQHKSLGCDFCRGGITLLLKNTEAICSRKQYSCTVKIYSAKNVCI